MRSTAGISTKPRPHRLGRRADSAAAGGAIAARLDASPRSRSSSRAPVACVVGPGSVGTHRGRDARALDQLGVITGRVDPDEVLGLIFKTFCIGK